MIPLPNLSKIIKKEENVALFEIEGLYPGYGVTIGNSLRRVLLSSLEGAAITRVKIKGVQHEFSTIPGVLEDVLRILLNLKHVRCKVYSSEPVKIELKVKGEKEVKAGDFEVPAQAEIVNKECHIATLTSKNASLEMECWVEKGVGYVPAERLKKGKLEVGSMVLDAIFTPVKRVAFRTENMRVGERTDFDRLFLEIETDGTISPQEAFNSAVDILIEHFKKIKLPLEKEKEEKKVSSKTESIEEDVTKKPIEELGLSTRTLNALLSNNIKTVGGLLRKSESSLSELEGLGEVGIGEIKKALKKLGLELK